MNTISIALAAAGCTIVMIAWGTYLATIPKAKVPARPVGTIILQLSGMLLAVAGILWSMRDGGGAGGVAVIAPALFAMMMGSTFLFLMSQRKTPVGDIRVQVGDDLLRFEANDSEGNTFSSGELAGKRILLKFFRGHW